MDIKAIIKKYKSNESRNAHSENALLLAKHFGTEADIEKAVNILAVHLKEGSISHDLYMQRYEMSQPLYRIMMGIGK